MDSVQKIVWSEGMFLRPQHFQQQERYLEYYAHSRNSSVTSYFWGFTKLKIDRTALAIGKLALLEAEGIMPDGTPFSLSAQTTYVEPLSLKEGAVGEIVYLSLPVRRVGVAEVAFEEGSSFARYNVIEEKTHDINTVAAEEVEVQVAQPCLRVKLESELNNSSVSLPIARILECRSDKQVILDEDFIPCVLSAQASNTLHLILKDVYGLVNQRASILAERLQDPRHDSLSGIVEFLMLQLLNRVDPVLLHMINSAGVHPKAIYELLIQVAGELATYSVERRVTDLPQYKHEDLQECLPPIVAEIRKVLVTVLEQNVIQIPFIDHKYGIKVGQINDRNLLKGAQFVLAVSAAMPSEVLRQTFLMQVKVGPVDRISDLVNLHLPGIKLNSLATAPRQIPYSSGCHYFELDTSSDLWEQLNKATALALHVAGEFPRLKIECWAIRH